MARDAEAGGEDRTDFGAVLAELVVAPSVGELPRTDGTLATASPPLVSIDAPPSSLLVPPPDAPVGPTPSVTAAPIVLEPTAPGTPVDRSGAEDRAGLPLHDEDSAAPPPSSLPAASAAAEVIATEMVRLVAGEVGGGSRSPSAVGKSSPEGTVGSSAHTVATPAGTNLPRERRPVAEDLPKGAGLAAPLTGLRELVRGTTARSDRAPTDPGELAPVGRGDTTAAVGSLPVASARPRSAGGASDAVVAAGAAMPRYEGAAPPSAAPPDGVGDEPIADVAAPAQVHDGDADIAAGPLVEGDRPSSAESTPHPLTVAAAAGGGSRDTAAAVARSAAPAPPPPPAPPAAPVPTSHATLDLALGDGTTGRLRVAVRGDVVHATILAEGAAAITLERELPSLRRSLAERGFPEAQLTVRAAIGEVPLTSPPPTSSAMPERPATGRERDEGTPRHPHSDRQDPTEDQRPRERRRPPQPEEYP